MQHNGGRDNSEDETGDQGKRSPDRIVAFLMHLLHYTGSFRDNFKYFQGSGIGFYGDHGNYSLEGYPLTRVLGLLGNKVFCGLSVNNG